LGIGGRLWPASQAQPEMQAFRQDQQDGRLPRLLSSLWLRARGHAWVSLGMKFCRFWVNIQETESILLEFLIGIPTFGQEEKVVQEVPMLVDPPQLLELNSRNWNLEASGDH